MVTAEKLEEFKSKVFDLAKAEGLNLKYQLHIIENEKGGFSECIASQKLNLNVIISTLERQKYMALKTFEELANKRGSISHIAFEDK